jgi:hypothetical protein
MGLEGACREQVEFCGTYLPTWCAWSGLSVLLLLRALLVVLLQE